MQRARDQLLAGPRLAGDHHRRRRVAQAADGAEDFLHGLRLAKDFRSHADVAVCTALVQTLVNRTPNQFQRLVDIERFGQIFKRAALKRGDRAVQIGVSGHDDDRKRRITLLNLAQQVQPGFSRHADV